MHTYIFPNMLKIMLQFLLCINLAMNMLKLAGKNELLEVIHTHTYIFPNMLKIMLQFHINDQNLGDVLLEHMIHMMRHQNHIEYMMTWKQNHINDFSTINCRAKITIIFLCNFLNSNNDKFTT